MQIEHLFWSPESLFQRQGHWLRHARALEWLKPPVGLDDTVQETKVTCGPVSFAAITGMTLPEATSCFSSIEVRSWTTRTDMERALLKAQLSYTCQAGVWPHTGLCLIQFTGPWTRRQFAQAALKHTHWIAVLGEYIFDINWSGWLPRRNWEDVVLWELLASRSAADGWRVLTGYEMPVNVKSPCILEAFAPL
jgi:hypothetical protein